MSGAANAYHFVTRWRVEATCGEVADILSDSATLARWWPAVYLEAEEIAAGDPRGLGRRVRLLTKGWLPYTLRWEFAVIESRYPHGLTIDADGDLIGRGTWTLVQDGAFVDVTYDWRVRAQKPLLRSMSFAMRPLFAANHRWAMRQGEESLGLELRRRRAATAAMRATIPPPPGPITYAGVTLLAGALLAGGTFAYVLGRLAQKAKKSRDGRL